MTRILTLADSAGWSELAQKLRGVRSLLVITGAGVSAESGISTFRGAGGFWEKFRAEELASPEGFRRDPELVWRWYHERRQALLENQPNPGHFALAELETLIPDFTLVTQNVDGYHRQAGSRNIVEIHGSIWELRCTREGKIWEDHLPLQVLPVYCSCGALARPNVLWFGEVYDGERMRKAQAAAARAELIVVAGTSGMVWIVSGLLQVHRGEVIEVNLEPTDLTTQADLLLQGPSGQVFPRLLDLMNTTEGE